MMSQLKTVLPIWAGAVVAAILVGVLAAPGDHLLWMPISLAGLVLATFLLQLAVLQFTGVPKEGIVDRMMLSIVGAIVVLGVATAALAVLVQS